MSDPIFENPKLVAIYDHFDGSRQDLTNYLSIIEEFNAKSILDVGCGTGCLASLLSGKAYEVIAVDPAAASIELAQQKAHAENVRWICGDTSQLNSVAADLAIMTGNVAQVFLSDEAFEQNLTAIHKALRPDGHLIFEVRDPAKQAWLEWTREKTYQRIDIPKIGFVEGWCEILAVDNELVTFRWNYFFESSGEQVSSESTLRFREKGAIIELLNKAAYSIQDIRDAADRPGKEFVFIAKQI